MRSPGARTALAIAAGVLAGSVLGQGAPVAWAAFHEQAGSTSSISADVLAPPSAVAVSAPHRVVGSHAVDVTWTARRVRLTDGYEVLLSTAPEGPYAVAPVGTDATQRTLTSLDRKATYHVVVASTRGSWHAGSAAVSVTTPPRNCD